MQSSCPVPRSTSVLRILVTRNSHEYGCNFFEEAEVNAVFTLCTAPILVFLLCKLRRMNDAFKLRREMCWTYYTSLLLSSERTAACVAFDLTSIQPNVSSKVFAHRSRIVDIKCFVLDMRLWRLFFWCDHSRMERHVRQTGCIQYHNSLSESWNLLFEMKSILRHPTRTYT